MKNIRMASPLYILREECARDLDAVLCRLSELGFDGIEFLGFFGHSGVMPIIFANALIMFPQLISSIFWPESTWYQNVLGTDSWAYIVLTALLILFFAYFYAQISFNTDDISRRIQQNGGFIPGIRPGKPTTEYLKRISHRITLFGAIFLSIVALVPSLIFKGIDLASSQSLVGAFSATGLLIIVSVALDFEKRLDAQLMMRTYKGFLK